MEYRCDICQEPVTPGSLVHCRHCNATYHIGCIKNHLYTSKSCPSCGKLTSLMHYRKGAPRPDTAAPGPRVQEAAPRPTYHERPTVHSRPPAPLAAPPVRQPPVRDAAPPAPRQPPAQRPRPRGGIALLFLNFIVVVLLLGTAYYASSNYIGYAPDLRAEVTSASVLPGEEAMFPFVIENTGNLVAHYLVAIESSGTSLPPIWEAELYENDITFGSRAEVKLEPQSPQSFTLHVTTGGQDEANTQGTIKVSITSIDGKYRDSMVFNMATQAVHEYEVEQIDTTKYGSAGDTTSFSFMITNLGNISDTYEMRIETATSGWQASLLKGENLTIEAGKSASVIVNVKAPQNASGNDRGSVSLRVTSQKDPSLVTTLQFSMVVNPTYGFELLSSEQSRVVLSGTINTFTFKIRNVGNAADTYILTETGAMPPGWNAMMSKTEVTIPAGESATVGVTVSVPEDALASLKGISSVRIVSEGNDEAKTATFEVTTAAQQTKVVLLELFTSVNCGYCPFAEHAMEQLLLEYPGKVIALEYHLNDQFSIPFSRAKASYYGLAGTPQAMFDGYRKEAGGTGQTYANYVSKLVSLMNQELQLRIDVSLSPSDTPDVKTVSVVLKNLGLPASTELEIFFVSYRNGLSPTGSTTKVYNYVVTDGTSRVLTSLDSITTMNMNLAVPSDGGIVIYAQDRATKHIYQAILV